MTTKRRANRVWLAPEVVQTSAMDCGPAVLKCVAEGFRIPVSYGRLREACQTSVDGTSIDVLEAVAEELGLSAEQVMLPVDLLWLAETRAFPAVVVTRHNDGTTHFVVVWRRVGAWLQIMDPGVGRQWVSIRKFVTRIFTHSIQVDAGDWYEWAKSDSSQRIYVSRLRALGASKTQALARMELATASESWQTMAVLDAALRMLSSLRKAGALRSWDETADLLANAVDRAVADPANATEVLPAHYWSVSPAVDQQEELTMHGAVLLRVSAGAQATDAVQSHELFDDAAAGSTLDRELRAVKEEAPMQPARELWKLIRTEGALTPVALALAIGLAMGALVVEALLFRGLFDLASEFNVTSQRLFAVLGLLAFVFLLWIFEFSLVSETLRLGRHLETRLRVSLMSKLPKLRDRYLQSRPVSDMAERSHSIYALRDLPEQIAAFMRTGWELVFTLIGIGLIAPHAFASATGVVMLTFIVLLVARPAMGERDLRVRNQLGALQRFYLDALIGIVPVRTHAAERAVQREHEGLLVEWARSAVRPLRLTMVIESMRSIGSLLLIGWLLYDHLVRFGVTGDLLLLVYWVLKLPALGEQLVTVALQYPAQRSISLRLLELIKSPDAHADSADEGALTKRPLLETQSGKAKGVSIDMDNVGVTAAGHKILTNACLHLRPGEHIAVVGPSGAGKSSLLGVLLGFHQAIEGSVHVDGEPLDHDRLARLRQHVAWIDPAVQLWNRSLLENLRYSPEAGRHTDLGAVLEAADLIDVIARLREGLQSKLSEGGARLSGGEGQRVRLARALWQQDVRLALLDEPFRGLDRNQRQRHLRHARHRWRDATLLCVTHDVAHTTEFERVLVVENGRIVEDGSPQALLAQSRSRYRELIDMETMLQRNCWSQDGIWRRFRLENRRVVEPAEREAA